jgi:hypothetical protein
MSQGKQPLVSAQLKPLANYIVYELINESMRTNADWERRRRQLNFGDHVKFELGFKLSEALITSFNAAVRN